MAVSISYEQETIDFYQNLNADAAQQHILDILKNKKLPDAEKKVKITKCCDAKADLNGNTIFQKSSILKVAMYAHNSEEIFKFLLDNGASLKTKDMASPLHHAAFLGRVDLIDLFAKNGLDINSKDEKGDVPLHYAVRMNQTEAVKKLILLGADKTILDQAKKSLKQEARNEEIKKILSKKELSPKKSASDSQTLELKPKVETSPIPIPNKLQNTPQRRNTHNSIMRTFSSLTKRSSDKSSTP